MQTKHTPTPWKQYNERYPEQVLSAGGNLIADCYYSEDGYIESKANAAHIVKCVNSHEKLVEALKKILKMINNRQVYDKDAQSIIEQALKSAGEI